MRLLFDLEKNDKILRIVISDLIFDFEEEETRCCYLQHRSCARYRPTVKGVRGVICDLSSNLVGE